MTRHLAAAGATIQELNTVRRALSLLKGGGLARCAYPAQVRLCNCFHKTTEKDTFILHGKYYIEIFLIQASSDSYPIHGIVAIKLWFFFITPPGTCLSFIYYHYFSNDEVSHRYDLLFMMQVSHVFSTVDFRKVYMQVRSRQRFAHNVER